MNSTITSKPAAPAIISRRSLLGAAVAVGGAGLVLAGSGRAAASSSTPAPVMQYLLDAPVRAYDSRPGQLPDGADPNVGADDTVLVRSASRVIDVCYQLGSSSDPTGVPVTASAVLLNVTCVGTTGSSGYLKVWSDGVAEPSTSSVNWDRTGSVVANMVVSRCDGGYVAVKCGGAAGASTHVVIDVVGWFESLIG